MPETLTPTPTTALHVNTLVVLLAPDILGGNPGHLEDLRNTISSGPSKIRLLVRIAREADLEWVARLAAFGVPMQVLLAHGIPAPEGIADVAQMPPSSDSDETKLNELALALADWVIYDPDLGETSKLVLRATELGKPTISPGQALPSFPAIRAKLASKLDEILPGGFWRGIFGSIEQGFLEVLAWNRPGKETYGSADTKKKLRKILLGPWNPGAYFAPPEWTDVNPDRVAVDGSVPIVKRFEALDRSALRGSYVHRGLIWFVHLGAASAVLLAVFGALYISHEIPSLGVFFSIFELLLLVIIARTIIGLQRTQLQDRWTACRLAAEQLRIARMCLPLLVGPPAICITDKPPLKQKDKANVHSCFVRGLTGMTPKANEAEDLTFLAMSEVKRAVRDQGLPCTGSDFTPLKAAQWLKLIVADQAQYHDDNHRKLEQAEATLHCIVDALFLLAILAVVVHLLLIFWSIEFSYLLVFTAANPAFAAALHGAGTRLGVVHRAALSEQTAEKLDGISKGLDAFIKAPPSPPEEAWRMVRELALDAAEAMGQENLSWHGLVRRERDVLPA